MNTTVKDVMTTRVIAVRKEASFKDMVVMLRKSRISAFPVLDEADLVVGVVSEADLLVKEAVQADGISVMAALRHWHEDEKAAGLTAADLMTGPAVTIGPDASVAEAARLMYDRRVKRLPVVSAADLLVGIITRTDVLSVFDRADDQIRHEIVREVLPEVLGAVPEDCEVNVRDGIVTLTGMVDGEQDVSDVVAAVGHVQGVVAVRDRLSYPADRGMRQ